MLGLEMMMAKAMGKTPAEMQEIAERVSTAIFTSAEKIAEIHANTAAILERMEALECHLKMKPVPAQSKRTQASS